MQTPGLPKNEKARLEVLRQLNLLDTPPEERFERLTRMAKRVFNVPIVLITLIDENRQWFKSNIGLQAKETPRDISFCGHAILGDDIFVIPDASKNDYFADNPLVTGDPNIRFYAGCPIHSPEQHKLGTLCIIDTQPREIDNADIALLKDFAIMIESEIASNQLSTIDELTNINNRRGFLSLAEKSLSYCKRRELTSTLAFFDLNQFAHINDKHGYTAGDTALITFAELLQHHLRSYDICARLGDDEFVALFMDTTEEDAKLIINKLKTVVNQFNKHGHQPYNINFSYGLVEFAPHRNQNITDLFSDKDILKYEEEINLASEYLQNLTLSHQNSEASIMDSGKRYL